MVRWPATVCMWGSVRSGAPGAVILGGTARVHQRSRNAYAHGGLPMRTAAHVPEAFVVRLFSMLSSLSFQQSWPQLVKVDQG